MRSGEQGGRIDLNGAGVLSNVCALNINQLPMFHLE